MKKLADACVLVCKCAIAHISRTKTGVDPNQLRALAMLLDKTVRRSAVEQEDLELYCTLKKGPFWPR